MVALSASLHPSSADGVLYWTAVRRPRTHGLLCTSKTRLTHTTDILSSTYYVDGALCIFGDCTRSRPACIKLMETTLPIPLSQHHRDTTKQELVQPSTQTTKPPPACLQQCREHGELRDTTLSQDHAYTVAVTVPIAAAAAAPTTPTTPTASKAKRKRRTRASKRK